MTKVELTILLAGLALVAAALYLGGLRLKERYERRRYLRQVGDLVRRLDHVKRDHEEYIAARSCDPAEWVHRRSFELGVQVGAVRRLTRKDVAAVFEVPEVELS